jgi:hypothetical protein
MLYQVKNCQLIFFPLRLFTLNIALFDHYPLFFWSRLLEFKTNEKVKIT